MCSVPSNINELLQRIEKVFNKDLAWTLGEYLVLHQFDAWEDIVEDIDTSYDDCCCKIVLFEQLKIADITQKRNEYFRLKQCLWPDEYFEEFMTQSHTKHIIQEMNISFDGAIANIISQSFEYIVDEEQFEELEAIQEDIEDIENSLILAHVSEQIGVQMQSVPSDINIQMIKTKIQEIVMKNWNNREIYNKIEESMLCVLLPLIKPKTKLIPKQYFDVMEFDLIVSSKDIESAHASSHKALCIVNEIDIKNRKPIMLWLLNLYSTERCLEYIEKEDTSRYQYPFTVTDWWQQNNYCKWIEKKRPIIAKHMKHGINELCKRVLPPMDYNYTKCAVIWDELNDFVGYCLAFHRMMYRLNQLMRKREFNAAPIKVDLWIIPQTTMPNTRARSNGHMHGLKLNIQDASNCIPDTDYFTMNAQKQLRLATDLYHLLATYNRWDAPQSRGNRYVFIIDRRSGTKATIHMITPKQDENEKEDRPPLPQSCLGLSKSNILFNANTNANITMHDALNGYMFAMSYHVLSEDNIYLYWYHNGGGSTFQLKDIQNRWPQWFHRVDGEMQQISGDTLQEINDCDKLLSNVEFEEFKRQCNLQFN